MLRSTLLLIAAAVAVACGTDDGGAAEEVASSDVVTATSGSDTTAPAPSEPTTADGTSPDTTSPGTTGPNTTAPGTTSDTTAGADPTTNAGADVAWTSLNFDDPGCRCADGSSYWLHELERDPTRVLLFFQGGGACFNEQMCSFTGGTYKPATGPDDHPRPDDAGIWEFDNPQNPFADWSVVFVPYCTGDVFLGDTETTYGDDLLVRHRGAAHARKGLDHVLANYPDLEQLVVAGTSAGGVPTPKIAGLAADALPDADIAALADASGGYPSTPGTNQFIGQLWGTYAALPDWPEFEGVDPVEIGIPDLFTFAGLHAPSVRMARFDNAYDQVQAGFARLAGLDGGVVAVLDANEAKVEGAGVALDVYVAPGTGHTILARPELYDLEVEGVAFVDWLNAFVAGESPGDVHCTQCE